MRLPKAGRSPQNYGMTVCQGAQVQRKMGVEMVAECNDLA